MQLRIVDNETDHFVVYAELTYDSSEHADMKDMNA